MKIKEIISLLKEIRNLLKEKQTFSKEFLNIEESSLFLGISVSTLYKLTGQNKITYYKPSGKLIYFKRTHLIDFIESNPILSRDELDEMTANAIIKSL